VTGTGPPAATKPPAETRKEAGQLAGRPLSSRRTRPGQPGQLTTPPCRLAVAWSAILVGMFDDLLDSNRRYAAGFDLAGLQGQAKRGFALVTCIDTRIEPLPALGLRPGDAKILRNAGGRATPDVLRSLALATTFLGIVHVAVMHHTDCAMARLGDADVRSRFSPKQQAATAGWDFWTMTDPDRALADDVAAIAGCAALAAGVAVEGWRYDVATGLIHRVAAEHRP